VGEVSEWFTLEDRNYYTDYRVRAREEPNWYHRFDERKMTAYVTRRNEEGEKYEHSIKCEYQICEVCQGKGSHVNPSIDCGGLSREDLDEDPDFAEMYFDGGFDVPCYGCQGKRVVPEPVNPEELYVD
jgi:hypothetical protein